MRTVEEAGNEMPLFTYVVAYKGESYIAQTRRSNPKGFPDWMEALPKELRNNINPYGGSFEPMPNRQHVWRKSLTVGDHELTIVAVQTVG